MREAWGAGTAGEGAAVSSHPCLVPPLESSSYFKSKLRYAEANQLLRLSGEGTSLVCRAV